MASKVMDAARAAVAEVEPDDDLPVEGDPIEADPGEPEGDPAPDQPEQPPAPAEPTQAQVEAIWANLGRHAEKHRAEVEKRSKDMWPHLAPCPLCLPDAPGFLFPEPGYLGDPGRQMAVRQLLGIEDEPEYESDEQAEVCSRCKGRGKLRTGSLVPEQITRVCPDCSGQGWKAHVVAPATPQVFTPAPPAPVPQPYTGGNGVAFDAWQRPAGHPHFGRPPAEVM